jgi:hypothetical protein
MTCWWCCDCRCCSGAVAQQARYLEQKLKLQQGEDDTDGDEEDDDDQRQQQGQLRDKLWGANKRAYYQTEDAAEVGPSPHLGPDACQCQHDTGVMTGVMTGLMPLSHCQPAYVDVCGSLSVGSLISLGWVRPWRAQEASRS